MFILTSIIFAFQKYSSSKVNDQILLDDTIDRWTKYTKQTLKTDGVIISGIDIDTDIGCEKKCEQSGEHCIGFARDLASNTKCKLFSLPFVLSNKQTKSEELNI